MTSEKLKCRGGVGDALRTSFRTQSTVLEPYLAAQVSSCRLLLFFEGICDFLSERLWVLWLLHHISLGAQLIEPLVDRER
jgi:hypothetical protein